MKSGFSLLETIIVLFVSAMLSLTVYRIFYQSSSTVNKIVKIIDLDDPIIPFYNQLELDVTGMFALNETTNFYADKLKEQEKPKSKAPETPPANNPQNINKKPDDKEKKPEIKVILNNFFIKVESNSLFLSFITTSGIQMLDYTGTLRPDPLIRRVAYILRPDEKNPGSFKLLYRMAIDNLDLNHIQSDSFEPTYEIISKIKNLKVEVTVFEIKEKKAGQEDSDNKEESKSIDLADWTEEEVFKKYKTLIPAYISFKGSYYESNVEYPFEYDFKIPAYRPYVLKKLQDLKI